MKNSYITDKKIQKWVSALRSGKYSQTTKQLQDENGYCCLGVACDLFIPKKNVKINGLGFMHGQFPRDQKEAPYWLQKISGQMTINLGTGLYEMNDQLEFDFDEIADVLELVYIHKALD